MVIAKVVWAKTYPFIEQLELIIATLGKTAVHQIGRQSHLFRWSQLIIYGNKFLCGDEDPRISSKTLNNTTNIEIKVVSMSLEGDSLTSATYIDRLAMLHLIIHSRASSIVTSHEMIRYKATATISGMVIKAEELSVVGIKRLIGTILKLTYVPEHITAVERYGDVKKCLLIRRPDACTYSVRMSFHRRLSFLRIIICHVPRNSCCQFRMSSVKIILRKSCVETSATRFRHENVEVSITQHIYYSRQHIDDFSTEMRFMLGVGLSAVVYAGIRLLRSDNSSGIRLFLYLVICRPDSIVSTSYQRKTGLLGMKGGVYIDNLLLLGSKYLRYQQFAARGCRSNFNMASNKVLRFDRKPFLFSRALYGLQNYDEPVRKVTCRLNKGSTHGPIGESTTITSNKLIYGMLGCSRGNTFQQVIYTNMAMSLTDLRQIFEKQNHVKIRQTDSILEIVVLEIIRALITQHTVSQVSEQASCMSCIQRRSY